MAFFFFEYSVLLLNSHVVINVTEIENQLPKRVFLLQAEMWQFIKTQVWAVCVAGDKHEDVELNFVLTVDWMRCVPYVITFQGLKMVEKL